MDVSFTENSQGCILKLHSNISFESIFKLETLLEKFPQSKPIALNLQEVDYICIEFLELLKRTSRNRKISLINLQAELFVLLNLTKYDKFAHIFLNDFDFIQQKRALLNRRFAVI